MGFAGFAVDIGAWYSQAPSLQRASDAAALAGVVWRPNFSSAESAARAEATRNGFTHGVDGITVTVAETGNNRLEVEIVDTDADLYFASLYTLLCARGPDLSERVRRETNLGDGRLGGGGHRRLIPR